MQVLLPRATIANMFFYFLTPHRVLDPFLLPHMQVDKGAIRFILSGANIMCPGLTSPGAKMTKLETDAVVVRRAARLTVK